MGNIELADVFNQSNSSTSGMSAVRRIFMLFPLFFLMCDKSVTATVFPAMSRGSNSRCCAITENTAARMANLLRRLQTPIVSPMMS